MTWAYFNSILFPTQNINVVHVRFLLDLLRCFLGRFLDFWVVVFWNRLELKFAFCAYNLFKYYNPH